MNPFAMKICIFYKDVSWKNEIAKYIEETMADELLDVKRYKNETFYKIKEGSIIRFLKAECACGVRCNIGYLQPEIEYDFFKCVISPFAVRPFAGFYVVENMKHPFYPAKTAEEYYTEVERNK